MRAALLSIAIAALGSWPASVHAQEVEEAVKAGAASLGLQRVVVDIGHGTPFVHVVSGRNCKIEGEAISWGEDTEVDADAFKPLFDAVVKKAGYGVEGFDNLFEPDQAPDLLLAARIRDISAVFCEERRGRYWTGANIKVDWQVFSTSDQKIVEVLSTEGEYVEKDPSSDADGVYGTIVFAFGSSLEKALSEKAFLRAAARSEIAKEDAAKGTLASRQDIIKISGTHPTAPKTVGEAIGSVVAIIRADGHGSGFLVSDDGYILTNEHVVKGVKQVKVRWSDGFETVGEVVRTEARRDVALIKTDARRRAPLNLRLENVRTGEGLYAVGAPLDAKLQGTVTKGVASATRIVDGFAYVQSDVAVQPGNSGGPLMDEQSRVVGIAASMLQRNGASTNINMFIPVADALEFLRIKME